MYYVHSSPHSLVVFLANPPNIVARTRLHDGIDLVTLTGRNTRVYYVHSSPHSLVVFLANPPNIVARTRAIRVG